MIAQQQYWYWRQLLKISRVSGSTIWVKNLFPRFCKYDYHARCEISTSFLQYFLITMLNVACTTKWIKKSPQLIFRWIFWFVLCIFCFLLFARSCSIESGIYRCFLWSSNWLCDCNIKRRSMFHCLYNDLKNNIQRTFVYCICYIKKYRKVSFEIVIHNLNLSFGSN